MLKCVSRLVSVIALASVFTLVPRVHIAAAAASDKRAPVKVEVSPREAFATWIVFREHGGFKGEDDQDGAARIAEALDIAGIKAAVRANLPKATEATDFSAKPKARSVARDDLERLVKWIGETAIDEDTNTIVNPLKDRIQRAIDAK